MGSKYRNLIDRIRFKYGCYFSRGIWVLVFLFFLFEAFGQSVGSPTYDSMLKAELSFSVKTISCAEANALVGRENIYFLDTRTKEEYKTSHIPGARLAGFENFRVSSLTGIQKSDTIITYCSVGYRSEKIGEQLQKAGYTNVFNIYGGLFEYVNQGFEVVRETGSTQKIHGFDRNWSQWITNEEMEIKY